LKDAAGVPAAVGPIALTLDMAVAGAGGLDFGAEAANTWYYGHVIWNKTTGAISGVISTSPTNPTLPAGFTHWALATVVRNNGSSNFIGYQQRGRQVIYDADQVAFTALGPAAADVFQQFDCSAIVPPNAIAISGNFGETGSHSNVTLAASAGGAAKRTAHIPTATITFEGFQAAAPYADLPILTSQRFWWKASSTGDTARVTVTSFRF
jgi:hypothetical protein